MLLLCHSELRVGRSIRPFVSGASHGGAVISGAVHSPITSGSRLELFDVSGGHVVGRVGVAVDVVLRLLTEMWVQLMGVVAGLGGEGEAQRMAISVAAVCR